MNNTHCFKIIISVIANYNGVHNKLAFAKTIFSYKTTWYVCYSTKYCNWAKKLYVHLEQLSQMQLSNVRQPLHVMEIWPHCWISRWLATVQTDWTLVKSRSYVSRRMQSGRVGSGHIMVHCLAADCNLTLYTLRDLLQAWFSISNWCDEVWTQQCIIAQCSCLHHVELAAAEVAADSIVIHVYLYSWQTTVLSTKLPIIHTGWMWIHKNGLLFGLK